MFKFDMNVLVASQLAASGLKLDANETAAYARELEYVHAEVIAAKYPQFKFRDCVPLKVGAPLGATSHRWFEVDGFGQAQWLDNMATDDFPTVEVQGAENTGKIRSIGAKYMVTVEELRAAALMRTNVETEKQKLVRRGIESTIDKAVFGTYNTTNGGFKGLLHNDNSTAYTPDATYGSNGTWMNAGSLTDPVKIVYDLRGMADAAFIDTKGAFDQFDLFLPPELGVIMDQPMYYVVGTDKHYMNMSIGQFAIQNVARLRSIKTDVFRASGAGASSKHRAMLYPRDPEVLDCFLPLDFEQFAPQLSGMAFVTHAHAKFGGVRIKHIKAIRRVDLTATTA